MNQLQECLNHITDMFIVKFISGVVITLAMSQQGILFLGFVGLVILDLLTKWVAISYKYCKEQGMENVSYYTAIKGINAARKVRLINSAQMREQGISKLILYCICCCVGGVTDMMSKQLNVPPQMFHLVIGYMIANEALSIIENIGDAGVASMGKLIEILKKKLG